VDVWLEPRNVGRAGLGLIYEFQGDIGAKLFFDGIHDQATECEVLGFISPDFRVVVLIRITRQSVILDWNRVCRERDVDVIAQLEVYVFFDELRNSLPSPLDKRIYKTRVIEEMTGSVNLNVVPKIQCFERIGEVFTVLTVRRIC